MDSTHTDWPMKRMEKYRIGSLDGKYWPEGLYGEKKKAEWKRLPTFEVWTNWHQGERFIGYHQDGKVEELFKWSNPCIFSSFEEAYDEVSKYRVRYSLEAPVYSSEL